MKTLLRSLTLLLLSVPGIERAGAQCGATDIMIQNFVPVGTQTAGTCTATFDLSFTLQVSDENKYVFVHLWPRTLYPDVFDCASGSSAGGSSVPAPAANDLASAVINIGINNSGIAPALLTTYAWATTVKLNSGTSITKTPLPNGYTSFVVSGLKATFPGNCGSPVLLNGDAWTSGSASIQNAQCVSCNMQYALNFTQVTGFTSCANMTFNASINNTTNQALTGTYAVSADVNGDGFFNSPADAKLIIPTSFSLAANVGATVPVTGSIPSLYANKNLLVMVNITTPSASGTSIYTIQAGQCAPLPVTLQSFTAERRTAEQVVLRWQTTTEINNTGFKIERNSTGSWETVSFVPTRSLGGNSDLMLTYSFDDLNPHRGVTLYRLRQIDLNGRDKLSETRSVRGEGNTTKLIVYPNPSSDGRLSVLFESDRATRQVSLSDVSGRVIRIWPNITTNSLQLENLNTGIYLLKVVARETGAVSTQRIVVQ